jgi:NodT family efflux transporter outer membrane factor (OMF) lipoprotein
MKKRTASGLALVVMGAAVSGCGLDTWVKNGFKVGPNYTPPDTAMTAQWIDYKTAPNTESPDLARWWEVFNDPVLNSLMHDSYGQNLTLRQAGERIMAAKAGRDIAIGNIFPQTQNISGSHTVNKASNRTSPNESRDQRDQWFQDVNASLNIGWEIDFWGKFRRSIEASDATLDATVANYDNVMVLLLSEVATTYVRYRTFQERLYLAEQNAEIQRQGYELAKNKRQGGAATERDEQQARQVYEATRSLIPQFEAGVRTSNNALCVLLGIPVQDLSERLGDSGMIPWVPVEVAVGIPADLLRRRPDVRLAERTAAAQSAQIGVAEADLYPHFGISGSIGLNAEYIGGLWHTPGSLVGGIGPSFRWDILNYGRIENAVAIQNSQFKQALLAYQQTVLQADREAEDAIITLAKSKEREAILGNSVDAAQRTVQITYDQYKAGAVDFTPVFLFEQTLTEQQDEQAAARGDIALAAVELYRAMGGGWEARLTKDGIVGPPTTAPTTQRKPLRPDVLIVPATTRP